MEGKHKNHANML